MDMAELQKHIRHLAGLAETGDPVISCYVNLTDVESRWNQVIGRRFDAVLFSSASPYDPQELAQSASRIRSYLLSSELRGARGVAIFARQGAEPLWLPLKFSVPVPTWVSIDTLPNIYHLVELQDRYQQYVVLLSTKSSARIYDIALGEISKQMLLQKPSLRKRVGREWTRVHYQNHLRERGQRFLREEIEMLDHLLSRDSPACLVLAGDGRISEDIRAALPAHLAALVVDIVPLAGEVSQDEIVTATVNSFIAAQEQDSAALAEKLLNAFYKDDLAVIGAAECLQSLLRHQADVLIIQQVGDLGRARLCPACGWAVTGRPLPSSCVECNAPLSPVRDAREELVRLAKIAGRPVETIRESTRLEALGGVGCLLRYALGYSQIRMEGGDSPPRVAVDL